MIDDLGHDLRDERRTSGHSFAAFAKLAGFSESHLRSAENGTRGITPEIAMAYDRVLGTGGRFLARLEQDGEVRRRAFFGLAGALLSSGESPSRIGLPDVERLRSRFARLRGLDSHLGGNDTLHLYLSELARTESLLNLGTYTSNTRTSLVTLIGEQAQQAGWAAFDAGSLSTATDLYEYSRRAANEVGAADLALNAEIQLAYARPDAPVPSLDAIPRHGHAPVTTAMLKSRVGLALAMRGSPRQALTAIDQAVESLGKAPVGSSAPHWAAWLDETELAIARGRIYGALRRPRQAIGVLGNVLPGYPDRWSRDKALYSLTLAEAYAQIGELEQAATTAADAIDLAGQTSSVRPTTQAQKVVVRLCMLGAPNSERLRQRVAGAKRPAPPHPGW